MRLASVRPRHSPLSLPNENRRRAATCYIFVSAVRAERRVRPLSPFPHSISPWETGSITTIKLLVLCPAFCVSRPRLLFVPPSVVSVSLTSTLLRRLSSTSARRHLYGMLILIIICP